MTLRETWREGPLWALVGLVLVLGVVFMPAEVLPGDPLTMREESRAILLHGELAVEDELVAKYAAAGEAGQYVVENPRTGRSYSKYGSMSAWMYCLPLGLELLVAGELPAFDSPSRLVYLNLFNVALSVAVAASIYRTARRFDATPWAAAAFVTSCFYATYLWFFLRAQNSEILQLLFFAWAVTGFLDLLAEREAGARGWALARMWSACAALFLTKVSYVFVGPLFASGLAVDRKRRADGPWWRAIGAEAVSHAVPAALMMAAWATLNWVKFGGPFLTGYHVWNPQQHGLNGSLLEALPQLLFSAQWGLVFCFPVLAVALPFMQGWLRTRPVRFGTLVGIGIFYSLLLANLPSWHGAYTYGPRYWIFMLPFVSLPALAAWDRLRRRTPATMVAAAVAVGLLGYSTWLQVQVNRFPFFAYYELQDPLAKVESADKEAFFNDNTYGWIEWSMWSSRHRLDRLRWWRDIKAASDPAAVTWYEQYVQNVLGRGNLYFFPRAREE